MRELLIIFIAERAQITTQLCDTVSRFAGVCCVQIWTQPLWCLKTLRSWSKEKIWLQPAMLCPPWKQTRFGTKYVQTRLLTPSTHTTDSILNRYLYRIYIQWPSINDNMTYSLIKCMCDYCSCVCRMGSKWVRGTHCTYRTPPLKLQESTYVRWLFPPSPPCTPVVQFTSSSKVSHHPHHQQKPRGNFLTRYIIRIKTAIRYSCMRLYKKCEKNIEMDKKLMRWKLKKNKSWSYQPQFLYCASYTNFSNVFLFWFCFEKGWSL